MVHLTGPGMSGKASGSIAKVLTFAQNNKRNSLKKWSKPTDPQTPPQKSIRAMMGFLGSLWSAVPDSQKATWAPLAKPRGYAPYHAFVKYNMKRWRTFAPPATIYPPTETPFHPQAPLLFTQNERLAADIAIFWNNAPSPTAYTIHVQTASPITCEFDNCVHVTLRTPGLFTLATLQFPAAGTYYVRVRPFNFTGAWGTQSNQATAIPTDGD